METKKELEPELMSGYKPWYRKKSTLIIASIIIVGTISMATGLFIESRNYLYIDNAVISGQKISVNSQYPGTVSKLTATEGGFVKKGELLIRLDDPALGIEKNRAEKTYACSEVNLKLSVLNLQKAGNDYNRAQILFKSGAIPLVQYEQSEAEFNNIKIQKSTAEVKAASAKAQMSVAETQMKEMEIYSPDDGVVAKKWVDEGDAIQSGQILYTVYNLHNVSVLANIEETSLKNVHIGQEAYITIDAYPGRKLKGKVDSIFPCTVSQITSIQQNNAAGDFTKLTQYVSVRIMLEDVLNNNIAGRLPILPGMSVEVKLKV